MASSLNCQTDLTMGKETAVGQWSNVISVMLLFILKTSTLFPITHTRYRSITVTSLLSMLIL